MLWNLNWGRQSAIGKEFKSTTFLIYLFSSFLLTLKDLFRENFYFSIRFYTLRTSKIHWKKKSKSKNRPRKFDLENCPGSNRIVPFQNWKIAGVAVGPTRSNLSVRGWSMERFCWNPDIFRDRILEVHFSILNFFQWILDVLRV